MLKFKKITAHNISLLLINSLTAASVIMAGSENDPVYIKLILAVFISFALAGTIYYLLSLIFQYFINNFDRIAEEQLATTLGALYTDTLMNKYCVSPENFNIKFTACAEEYYNYDMKSLLQVYSIKYMINEDGELTLAVLPFTDTGIFKNFDVAFRKPYAIEAYTNDDNVPVVEIRKRPRKIPSDK